MIDIVERCRKGSCKRHNACMYAPCFVTPLSRPDLTAKPADQFLTENNEILRAEILRLRAELVELQQTNAEQATIIIGYGQQLAEARAKAFEEAAKADPFAPDDCNRHERMVHTREAMEIAAQAIRAMKGPED